MDKDTVSSGFVGNRHGVFVSLGATNHTDEIRPQGDYYATEPKAMELLLEQETFSPIVWECACGGGHLSEVLKKHGYEVFSTDAFYRGYGEEEPFDFLHDRIYDFEGDIVTNPPYKHSVEFVRRALEIVQTGHKVAMFLRLQFLEGKARRKLFKESPPKVVYVCSGRLSCARNGDFENSAGSAVAYAWFVWEKGFYGEPVIRWIN